MEVAVFRRFFRLKVLLRILFVVFVPAVAINALSIVYGDKLNPDEAYMYTAVAGVFALAVVIYEWRFQQEIVRDLVAIVFGTAVGLLVSLLIVLIVLAFFLPSSVTLEGLPLPLGEAFTQAFWRVQPWIPLILLACCYISITVVLQTKGDFRFLVPYIDFSQRGTQEGGILLDTSAIIDGRIVDICETRIIAMPLIIPDYVIHELQTLADSPNRMKRTRGRRGLDIVARLQKSEAARLVIRETEAPGTMPVDQLLVATAKEINGRIVTTDFNLNKVSPYRRNPHDRYYRLHSDKRGTHDLRQAESEGCGSDMNVSAIIPAAGDSTRMGGDIRKPYLLLAGEPLLLHTCRCLARMPGVSELVLAVHANDLASVQDDLWDILRAAGVTLAVAGGHTRAESVWKALAVSNPAAELVAVHDAVRPFLSAHVCARLFEVAAARGAAVPIVPAGDTIKRTEGDIVTETLRRRGLVRVQTPQVFRRELLVEAFAYAEKTGGLSEATTDDASLVEALGREVAVVLGEEYNFKITTPRDLRLAEALLKTGIFSANEGG